MRHYLADARTEWAFRWTCLTLSCYAILFFKFGEPQPWIDWSLLIQLAQGGNFAFYNYGWHYWFGCFASVGLAVGGCLTSIILPLLKDDVWKGYLVLMILLTALVAPCSAHLGVLSTLSGIGLLVVVIFVENIYVPVLNLRFILPDEVSIWSNVIRGSIVPAMVYIGLSWGLYAIPPWHSGGSQAFRLASQTVQAITGALTVAADTVESWDTNTNRASNEHDNDDCSIGKQDKVKEKLRSIGSSLFIGTNGAGIEVPLKLYASFGAYELSPLFPLTSLNGSAIETLSRRLDEAAFHCSVFLSLLGITSGLNCCLNENDGLRLALVAHLSASAKLADACAKLLEVERRQGLETKKVSIREKVVLNGSLWGWNGTAMDGTSASNFIDEARKESRRAAEALEVKVKESPSREAALLWALVRDTTVGNRPLSHFMSMGGENTSNSGTLGRLSDAAVHLQSSWRGPKAGLRQLLRMTMLEQATDLVLAWWRGTVAILAYVRSTVGWCCGRRPSEETSSLLQRRGFRRATQWLVGTWALYAMATWWEDFRTLFGSANVGPWTMVAFFVCFRPTVEETINAAILRSIGQGIGALLAWAVNEGVQESGGRMVIHGIITFVLTWLVPPPFVFPSSLIFPWDAVVGTGLIEGLLTTYHLTSSIVLTTDPKSASKARAVSQCLGSAMAAAVSVLILPWWAESEAEKSLIEFRLAVSAVVKGIAHKKDLSSSVAQLGSSVDKLLISRRDWSAVMESDWLGRILRLLGIVSKDAASGRCLDEKLLAAVLGGVALESVMNHAAKSGVELPTEVLEAIEKGDAALAASILFDAIPLAANEEQCDTYATCHAAIALMENAGLFAVSRKQQC